MRLLSAAERSKWKLSGDRIELAPIPQKTLFLDTETLPFDPGRRYERKVYGGYLKERPRNMVFIVGYSVWDGEGDIISDNLTPKEIRQRNDSRLVEGLTAILNQAHLVVGHNVDGADLTWIRTRAIVNQTAPLRDMPTYDTLKVARNAGFDFPGNGLSDLCHWLNLPSKGSARWGWADRLLDRPSDLETMAELMEYNKGDVIILPAVHERLMRYAK